MTMQDRFTPPAAQFEREGPAGVRLPVLRYQLLVGLLTVGALVSACELGLALLLCLPVLRGGELPGLWRWLAVEPFALLSWLALASLGLFVITLLSGELAGRLAREELAARGSLELARQQAQLNRLVIEEMVDGVLVVDHRMRVRAANPAARELLAEQGLAPSAPFPLPSRRAWLPLSQAVEAALADPSTWPEAGQDIALSFESGQRRTLRVRVRFMRRRDIEAGATPGEPFCVLLLEDVRTAEARLRQDKAQAPYLRFALRASAPGTAVPPPPVAAPTVEAAASAPPTQIAARKP